MRCMIIALVLVLSSGCAFSVGVGVELLPEVVLATTGEETNTPSWLGQPAGEIVEEADRVTIHLIEDYMSGMGRSTCASDARLAIAQYMGWTKTIMKRSHDGSFKSTQSEMQTGLKLGRAIHMQYLLEHGDTVHCFGSAKKKQ